MKDNQSIIEVLREAVTKDPENPALRLHLASLYLKDLNGAEALDQAARVLAPEPATRENAQGDFAFAEKVLAKPAEEMTDAVLDETDEIWELEEPGLKLAD